MAGIIIEVVVDALTELALGALAALFAWLTWKIGENQKLKNINEAKDEVEDAVLQTVKELQQTIVGDLKAAAVDGKLTSDEIAMLGRDTMVLVMAKLSEPCKRVLVAAGVDLEVYIQGAAEKWVDYIKAQNK